MSQDAENRSTMPDPRQDLRGLRARIKRRRYVDDALVADQGESS